MTTAICIPSHEKVAWAWLDKLVGRRPNPQEEAPPAQVMAPRERAQVLEGAFEEMKAKLTGWIRAEIPTMRRMQQQIARRHGLDGVYFDWFLINGKNWPSLPQKTRDGLRAAQSIFMFFGAVPDHWNNMVIPEIDELRQRDAAFREFGDWFVRTFIRKIERQYVRMIHDKAHELVQVFRGPGAARDPAASVLLMRDFEKRLVAHRSALRPALVPVVDLFS